MHPTSLDAIVGSSLATGVAPFISSMNNKPLLISLAAVVVIIVTIATWWVLNGRYPISHGSQESGSHDLPSSVLQVIQSQPLSTVTTTGTTLGPQSTRLWKRYHNARLGFSVDYPADSFTVEDGVPQGEEDTVAFVDRDKHQPVPGPTPGSYIEPGSDIEVTVESSNPAKVTVAIDPSAPYSTTTLAGLPAEEQAGSSSYCTNCEVRIIMIHQGLKYGVDINNVLVKGADYLSPSDIEHIRESFSLQ
jgi:hypothetical protein